MNFDNIYIHVPFCSRKCGYCSFYSEADPSPEQVKSYLKHLDKELRQIKFNNPVKTIYFGGGTPSLLACDDLQQLLNSVKSAVLSNNDTEITMECNPETLDQKRLDIISREVNRISIGIQAFDTEMRSRLGRISNSKHIESALDSLKNRKFENVSIDLIYGIPGQTLKDWRNELKMTVDAGIKHISCYALTLEEGTALCESIGHVDPLNDDLSADMWELAGEFLQQHGVPRYEVSNYSAPGSECKHNTNIWYGQSYLGLGPAASSFDGRMRWTQPASLEQWLNGEPPEKDIIEPEYRLVEIFIIGLRTVRGWNRELWESVPLQSALSAKWTSMLGRALEVKDKFPDLLMVEPDLIALTPRGLLFWNSIAEAWME